jgi:hypothetical protein
MNDDDRLRTWRARARERDRADDLAARVLAALAPRPAPRRGLAPLWVLAGAAALARALVPLAFFLLS